MNNNIILECRQSDTNSITNNGIYESYLANDVIIEQGDVLMLKNAFIDTKTESNIIIPSDLILTMNYGVYFTDWIEETGGKREYVNSAGVNFFINQQGSPIIYQYGSVYVGQRFIPYYLTQSTGVEYQDVISVTYNAMGQIFGQESPEMPVVYQYVDALTNNLMTVHRTIPATEGGDNYTDVLGFLIKEGSFQIVSPTPNQMEENYYWKLVSENIVPTPAQGLYTPYIFTKTFTLPAGSYSPDNLSLYISKRMSENIIDGGSATISNDSFVKYVSQFAVGAPYPNVIGGTGVIDSDGTYFFSDDMTTRFRFGSAPPSQAGSQNYLFGATQTALEFDIDSGLFNWAYLHSPLYDQSTGTNISCRIANTGKIEPNDPDFNILNNYIKTTDNGGVFFTGLSARTTNGQFYDFWSGVLGFNLSKICASPAPPTTTIGNDEYFGLTGKFYSYNLIPTVNITSGYSGVDNSIIKAGATASPNVFTIFTIDPPSNHSNYIQNAAVFSNISTTTALVADTPYGELLNKFSHYIIDSDLHFIGNYIGLDKYNNIQGLVSKYYQTDNYIVGNSDGSIEYTHTGFPLMLKSIKVRILRSDKTADPNLGPDNTIIFQLIKSNQLNNTKK